MVELNVKVEEAGPHNPHSNSFYTEHRLLKTEQEGGRDCDQMAVRHWLVKGGGEIREKGEVFGKSFRHHDRFPLPCFFVF